MTLFGKSIFSDVLKDLEMRRSPGLSRWALTPMTSVLIIDTQRGEADRRGCDVKTEEETRVMQLQAKDGWVATRRS